MTVIMFTINFIIGSIQVPLSLFSGECAEKDISFVGAIYEDFPDPGGDCRLKNLILMPEMYWECHDPSRWIEIMLNSAHI